MEGIVLILPKHCPNIKSVQLQIFFYNSAKFYQTLKGEREQMKDFPVTDVGKKPLKKFNTHL